MHDEGGEYESVPRLFFCAGRHWCPASAEASSRFPFLTGEAVLERASVYCSVILSGAKNLVARLC